MYCRNCGREIDAGTNTCPHCSGNNRSIPNKIPHSSKGAVIAWVFRITAILCIAVSLFFGISYYREPATIEKIDTLSIVSNNLQNGGYASADGQYHYCFNESGLIKIPIDDIQIETVFETNNIFGLDNNWVYAYCGSLFFADTDCIRCQSSDGDISVIQRNEMFRSFFAEDSQAYYIGSQSSPYTLLYTNIEIAQIPANQICQYGLKLYVFSGEVVNGEDNLQIGLWRIDLDGGNAVKLLDYCPEYFMVWGEQAFFTNGQKLYVSKTDGTDATLLPDINVGSGFNVDSEYIYYVDAESETIFRADKSGKKMKQLTDGQCSSIMILDEWMFYLKRENGTKYLCRMNLNTLEEQIVVENWS